MDEKKGPEWNRLMMNPDNLILSEDLLDRISPSEIAETIESSVVLEPEASLIFEEGEMMGTLTQVSRTKNDISLMVSVPSVSAFGILSMGSLTGYRLFTNVSDSTYEGTVDKMTDVDVSIGFFEPKFASVTISITGTSS